MYHPSLINDRALVQALVDYLSDKQSGVQRWCPADITSVTSFANFAIHGFMKHNPRIDQNDNDWDHSKPFR